MSKLYITVRGGVVQSVKSDTPIETVELLDWDTEDKDQAEGLEKEIEANTSLKEVLYGPAPENEPNNTANNGANRQEAYNTDLGHYLTYLNNKIHLLSGYFINHARSQQWQDTHEVRMMEHIGTELFDIAWAIDQLHEHVCEHCANQPVIEELSIGKGE